MKISILRGNADDWDGRTSIYGLQVSHPRVEPFLVAGLWSDVKDGCVNLFLD